MAKKLNTKLKNDKLDEDKLDEDISDDEIDDTDLDEAEIAETNTDDETNYNMGDIIYDGDADPETEDAMLLQSGAAAIKGNTSDEEEEDPSDDEADLGDIIGFGADDEFLDDAFFDPDANDGVYD